MLKQIHFRIEEDLWVEFKKLFPYKGEPSAFLKRCIIAAITHSTQTPKESEVIDIIKKGVIPR
jgi:hypothetical protein